MAQNRPADWCGTRSAIQLIQEAAVHGVVGAAPCVCTNVKGALHTVGLHSGGYKRARSCKVLMDAQATQLLREAIHCEPRGGVKHHAPDAKRGVYSVQNLGGVHI